MALARRRASRARLPFFSPRPLFRRPPARTANWKIRRCGDGTKADRAIEERKNSERSLTDVPEALPKRKNSRRHN